MSQPKFEAPIRECKFQFFLNGEQFETCWFHADSYEAKKNAIRKAIATDSGRLFVIWKESSSTGYKEIK